MAETMTTLVERHRAYMAAYSAADFGADPIAGEKAWLETADTQASELIEGQTPRLRNQADLLAAVSYLIEDRGFIQQGHRNVLQRVMEYLTQPESEPDPLLKLIEAYRAGVEIQNAIPDAEWDEKAGAVEAEHIKPHHARLETDPPAATSLAGVMVALQLVADENDIGDTPDLTAAVSRAALAYFNPKAATIAETKSANTAAFAAAEFEPWEGKAELMERGAWLSWLETLNYCIATMHRTKPEMVAMFRDIPDAATDLQERMATLAEFLRDMEGLATGASQRLLVAAAMVIAEDASKGGGAHAD